VQKEALHTTLSAILWRIADKGKAWVCLPQDIAYIKQSQEYFQDSVTEKVRTLFDILYVKQVNILFTDFNINLQLHLFEFSDLDSLQVFLKRYLYVVSIEFATFF
jgi:hypothetical protein